MSDTADARPRDWLADPLPLRADGKRFREVSLVEQHELLFRFLEEALDEIRAIKRHLNVADQGAGEAP